MLYLAKVRRNNDKDDSQLLLMAQQSAEQDWIALPTGAEEIVLLAAQGVERYSDGDAVLIELSSENEITTVKDATAWLLDLVSRYLTAGLTPEDLKSETERIEQWRKSLTLQSQDVVRQTLEIETRRDQIQELETKLEQEHKQLGETMDELREIKKKLEQERNQLNVLEAPEDADTRLPDPTNTLG